jgi:hypothetical protein
MIRKRFEKKKNTNILCKESIWEETRRKERAWPGIEPGTSSR